MFDRTPLTKFIAPRRQERKERPLFYCFPNLGAPFDLAQDMLCAFARVMISEFFFILPRRKERHAQNQVPSSRDRVADPLFFIPVVSNAQPL